MQSELKVSGRVAQYQNLLQLIGESTTGTARDGLPLKASHARSIVNCHRLAEAYKEQSRVAFITEQFPTELTFAFEALPWNIESMSTMLAQSLDVDRIFQLTQERSVSRDLCSFLRGPYGMMLADCYPRPDVVLTNDQPCEGLAKVIYWSGQRYNVPVIPLHTPNTCDEGSVQYVAKQLQRVMSDLERVFGVQLNPDSLRASVHWSNEARLYYNKTINILRQHKLPGVSRELQEIFGMNYFGARQNVQVCKALYEEAVELTNAEPVKATRVLWIGQVPEESHEVLRHMGKNVEILYWAPLWHANSIVLDEDNPFRSMAERAIQYHWNAERMGADLERICDDFAVDAFFIASVWGCRNMMGLSPMIRDIAIRRKLKYLIINIDLVDRNNYAFNHVKNRVDAFLELVQ
ncbi:MAG: 2-hydroxyacyl-CoA dehydratase family protein [Terracidiphilus sp.]|jgi:benzoyl-CoA reductase/2-hydroxyglutaryl-CoA dehydratase subunit BcrC/BadD/HgdB